MSKAFFTVQLEDEISKVEEATVLRKGNQVPVVDEERKLVDTVAHGDVIRAIG